MASETNQTEAPASRRRKRAPHFIKVLLGVLVFDLVLAVLALSYSATQKRLALDTGLEKLGIIMGSFGGLVMTVLLTGLVILALATVIESWFIKPVRYLIGGIVLVLLLVFGGNMFSAFEPNQGLSAFVVLAVIVLQTMYFAYIAPRNPNNKEEVKKDA